MALRNGRRREGSVTGRAFDSTFIEANAESLDRIFPPLPDRCLKRGHSHEERSWVYFLMAVCTSGGHCGAATRARRMTAATGAQQNELVAAQQEKLGPAGREAVRLRRFCRRCRQNLEFSRRCLESFCSTLRGSPCGKWFSMNRLRGSSDLLYRSKME